MLIGLCNAALVLQDERDAAVAELEHKRIVLDAQVRRSTSNTSKLLLCIT
jgi:hypothetical protein